MRQAYLLTRGVPRKLDYDFLGPPPPTLWWTSLSARDLVNLEQPEVIAYGNGQSLSVLLSGIPSAREDITGTPIRYTLVVDGLQDDVTLASELVVTGLSDGDRALFGRKLDETLDAAQIDDILSGARDSSKADEVLAQLLASGWRTADNELVPADNELVRADSELVRADSDGSWARAADDEQALPEFLSRVGTLASGTRGFAFTTHRLATRNGAEQALRELPGSNAILVVDGVLDEVVRLGKGLPEVRGRHSSHLRIFAGAGAAAATLLIALVVVLLILS